MAWYETFGGIIFAILLVSVVKGCFHVEPLILISLWDPMRFDRVIRFKKYQRISLLLH